MSEVEDKLIQIEAQCRIARQALADEHEGDLTRAVWLIGRDAEKLERRVATW